MYISVMPFDKDYELLINQKLHSIKINNRDPNFYKSKQNTQVTKYSTSLNYMEFNSTGLNRILKYQDRITKDKFNKYKQRLRSMKYSHSFCSSTYSMNSLNGENAEVMQHPGRFSTLSKGDQRYEVFDHNSTELKHYSTKLKSDQFNEFNKNGSLVQSIEQRLEYSHFIQKLLKTKAHLGTKIWNKNVSHFILGSRNNIFIFDIEYTLFCLRQAFQVIHNISKKNGHVLFLNTQNEYSELIQKVALLSNQSYINQRWIGGTLTNWKLISESLFLYKKFSFQFDIFLTQNNIQIPAYQKAKKRYEGILVKPTDRYLNIRNFAFDEGKKSNIDLSYIQKYSKHKTLYPEYLPDVIIITNPDQNEIVIKEAKIFCIPIIAFVDTNTNIQDIDYLLPGNLKSIRFIYFCFNLFTILLRRNRL